MRKITYLIDDTEFFREYYKNASNIDEILNKLTPFKCKYTLIGETGKTADKYLLTDMQGKAIDINSLNGYQKGVVLADCNRHFEGRPLESGTDMPLGCIKIESKNIVIKGTGNILKEQKTKNYEHDLDL